MPPTSSPRAPSRWQSLCAALVRAFHAYATWLVGISWKRFFVLALLLMISLSILSELPPFRWTISQTVSEKPVQVTVGDKSKDRPPEVSIETGKDGPDTGIEVSIGRDGVRVTRSRTPSAAASSASTAASAAQAAADAADKAAAAARESLVIKVPPGAASKAVNEVIAEARREILAAVEEARQEAQDAAEAARRDAEEASADASKAASTPVRRVHKVSLGDFLVDLALFWIVASIMIKITYKGRIQAEVKAARATETAEAESLKRQVAEARMAALQAQVEPHFLFNTLAAIDHLIETDPPRASVMQKNLITYLRATLQQMRESATTLGREVDLVSAYLEILKVRMEERLDVRIDIAQGLRSAVFPPMMLQSLVENAVKHGLEPSCDAATLTVQAEVADGTLRVSVADTGVGYDPTRGASQGPGLGLGLANIRERLEMMHGAAARFEIGPLSPRGTVATITLPYSVRSAGAAPTEPALPAGALATGDTMSA
jgi:signal transduction histidine kinase